jgi:hypothetical protein
MPSLKTCAAAAIAVALFAVQSPACANDLFDKPLKTMRVALPKDPDNPQAKPALTCTVYPHFMVKQIDLGEIGADQLSIIPYSGQPPACVKKNAANEKVVSADDWTGYFDGVKGDYVVFDAEDGWNDGLGFAVFDPNAKKLADDVQKKWLGVSAAPSGLTLHYERVYGAKCSLMSGDSCWAAIKKDTGLTGNAPDCAAAYRAEQKRTPKFATQVLTDPTIVDYEVTASIDSSGHKIVPLTGKALRCRPAE